MADDTATNPHAIHYEGLAESIRALLSQVKRPETRERLENLAADYERLAAFVNAMRRSAGSDDDERSYNFQSLSERTNCDPS